MKLTESELNQIIEEELKKELISEGQVKQIIREEFAAKGIVLTEEELNELFGLFGKSKLLKQIKQMDPEGSELDKLGYDLRTLKDLDKGALKQIAGELRDITGTKKKKGFFQKVKDVYAGVKDIGIISGGAGTLLGGEETFDIEKRNALKGTAKKQIVGWLSKLQYEPLTKLYKQLNKEGFPNNHKTNFKNNVLYIQEEYDKVVKDFESEQIDATRANTIIAVLRALVIYYQDFAMSDKNFYMVTEEEERMGAAQGAVSKNFVAAYGNKLPLGLAAAGVAALGVGFAADSPFFQNFLEGFKDMDTIPSGANTMRSVQTSLQLGEVKGGEGIIKVVRRLTPLKNFGRSGGAQMSELANHPKVVELIQSAMVSKEGPNALVQAIQQNANPSQLFVGGARSGTARAGEELFGLNKGVFEKNVTNLIEDGLRETSRVPADTVKNQFLKGLGNLLGPVLKALGLSALVAALASFTMRQKGKGKMGGSRMSMLKQMVDGFLDVKPREGEEKCPDGSDPPCEEEPPPPPEDPCKDKPGTKLDPETGECVCEEPGTIWSDKAGKCVKAKPPPGQPRIGLINLDDQESDVYYSRRKAARHRDTDRSKFKTAQDAGAIGDPAQTPGVVRKGSFQGTYPQQPSVKIPRTKSYDDFVRRLKGKSTSDKVEPYFTVDGSVITDALKALRGVKMRGKKKSILGLTQALVNRFADTEDKANRNLFRKLTKRHIKAPLTKQQRALLYNVYADYGLTVPKGQPLSESKELNRWKVLSGIK